MTDDIMAALARIEEQNRQIIAMLTGMPHVGGIATLQWNQWNQCPHCGAYYGLDGHLCPLGYPNR